MNAIILAGALFTGPVDLEPKPMPDRPLCVILEQSRWGFTPDYVKESWLLAVEYHHFVSSGVGPILMPNVRDWEAIREDAKYRVKVWDELDNVIRLGRYDSIQSLRKVLGEESFVMQRVPNPVPEWYYRGIP